MICRAIVYAFILGISLVPAPQQQTKTPTNVDRISLARAMYYMPTAQGLRGFHCGIAMDWVKLFQGFGVSLPPDGPVLSYLNSVHLSVSDSLHGTGSLEWADTGTPPDALVKPAAQIRDGMRQMIGGFFQSWNAYMNGSMIPAPDASTVLTEIPDGYSLHVVEKGFDTTEEFDSNLLLKKAHVITSELDVVATPVFEQTPEGLRVSTIGNVVRQPKTAAPVQLTMSITYASVSGYQIPSAIRVEIMNQGSFLFTFQNCAVDTDKK